MRSLLFIPADDERKLAKGVGCRRRRADPRPGGCGERAAQGRRARDRRAVHRGDARAREAAAALRAHQRARHAATGRTIWPASSARGPTASCCPRRAPARTCTRCRSRCNHAEERAGAPKGATRIIAIATEVPISLLQIHTYVGASTRLEGLTWGAEDLSAASARTTNREADGTLDLALSAGARSVPVHGRRRQRAADRHRVRRFPRRAGLAPGGRAGRPRRLHGQDGDPPRPGGRRSTRCSRRRPRRSPRAQEIVKAFADNPRRRRAGHRAGKWSTART